MSTLYKLIFSIFAITSLSLTDGWSTPYPSALSTTINHTNVSCNGTADGTATANPTGSTGSLTYLWSDGQTNATATNLAAGLYCVTVTDATSTVSTCVTITQPLALSVINFSVQNILCKNAATGQITATTSGGVAPYTYTWSNGQNSSLITGITAGTYSVTATDFNGCTITGSTTVTEPSASLTVNILNSQNPNCFNSNDGQIEVDAQGATPNYTYLWNNGQQTSIANNLTAGTHIVTITDANGCTITTSRVLTRPTPITLSTQILSNYNGAAISCIGLNDGSVGVTAAGGAGTYSYQWSPTGANTATIQNLVAGTYDVTVTDIAGCTADTNIIINDPTPLAATFSQVNILCHGEANGQILASATAGTGTLGINGYEYKLVGPNQNGNVFSNTNSYFNLVAGAYIVHVRDGNNCETLLNINITEPDSVLIDSIRLTSVLCNGDHTGTATAHSSGGNPPYHYIWSHDATQTTAFASGLAVGLHNVTVVDANNCDRVQVFNISEPTALVGSITANNITCRGGQTTATASATGGSPILGGYLYRWDNGSTNATAINLTAGVHCVSISDANACLQVSCITITEPSTSLSANIITQTNALCHGGNNGTATVQGTDGTAPYTYAWANGQTTATATNLPLGTHTVVVTDSLGCTDNTTVTISEPNPLQATINSTTAANCFGGNDGQAIVNGTGGTVPYTYAWANGQTAPSATNLAVGTAQVTLTDANGCQATANYTITAPTAIRQVQYDSSNISCRGGNDGMARILVVGGTPTTGYTYQWSGSNSTSHTANNLAAGTQYVTISDFNACQLIDTFTLEEPSQGLNGYLNNSPALCFGQASGELTATINGGTGNYTYTWSNGANTIAADSLVSGIYSITVSDSLNCVLVLQDTVGEAQAIQITANVVRPVSCHNGADGQANGQVISGGLAPYTYVWTDPAGQIGTVASNLMAGAVSLVVLDSNGCTARASVTLSEPNAITVQEVVQHISCHGEVDGAIQITGSNQTLVNYIWSNGQAGNAIQSLNAGSYTVTVTNNSPIACQDSFTFTIIEPAIIRLAISESKSMNCYEDDDARAIVRPSGGTAAYTYQWSGNGGAAAESQDLAAGTYSVTVVDANGCSSDTSIAISQPQELTIVGSPTTVLCQGDDNGIIVATGTGGTVLVGNLQYRLDNQAWKTGNIFQDLTAGDYRLAVTDENNCISDTLVTVNDADSFYISSITPTSKIEYLDSMEIGATLNDTTGVLFSWTNLADGGIFVTDSLWKFKVSPSQTTTYQLVATNIYGCELEAEVLVQVDKIRRAAAAAAFTPNGDDTNDYFFIQGGTKIEKVTTFKIYNRWGSLIFDRYDLTVNNEQEGWNGIVNGQPANSGTYIWYAEILYKDGHTKVLKGDVMLLR